MKECRSCKGHLGSCPVAASLTTRAPITRRGLAHPRPRSPSASSRKTRAWKLQRGERDRPSERLGASFSRYVKWPSWALVAHVDVHVTESKHLEHPRIRAPDGEVACRELPRNWRRPRYRPRREGEAPRSTTTQSARRSRATPISSRKRGAVIVQNSPLRANSAPASVQSTSSRKGGCATSNSFSGQSWLTTRAGASSTARCRTRRFHDSEITAPRRHANRRCSGLAERLPLPSRPTRVALGPKTPSPASHRTQCAQCAVAPFERRALPHHQDRAVRVVQALVETEPTRSLKAASTARTHHENRGVLLASMSTSAGSPGTVLATTSIPSRDGPRPRIPLSVASASSWSSGGPHATSPRMLSESAETRRSR